MKSRSLLTLTLFVLIFAGIATCKKKKNDNPFGNAKLALIDYAHNGSILHYRVVYDTYNNVDSLIYTGDGFAAGHNGFHAFAYFGSSYSVTDETNFSFTVLANSAGQILRVLLSDTLSTIYNGTQLGEVDIKTTQIIYPFYRITSTNYTWAMYSAHMPPSHLIHPLRS